MQKNWTGNKKSTFSTLGASSHSNYERSENDYYATSPDTIQPLLDQLKKDGIELPKQIWENASGENHLANKLEEYGYDVFCSDIIRRTEKTRQVDFLDLDEDELGINMGDIAIITNPPYKYAKEWVEQSMKTLINNQFLIMFLKLTFLEGQARKEMFKKYPPKYVYVFSARQSVARNGEPEMFKKSSAACYAWFVWEKGFKNSPQIKWI